METRYEKYEQTATFLKSIAHPVRICIILGLARVTECNVTDMKCGLDLPQSTVSTHLAVLREMGIVETVRRGTEIIYQLKDHKVVDMLNMIGAGE